MMATINRKKKILTVCVVLIGLCFAVFGQALWFDFIRFDDPTYVTENIKIQSPITLGGLTWMILETSAGYWHPLTWLSFMLDYQLYGLNAAGYHLTNLLLHILSTLLLFGLFHRMTREIWPSALVASLFALHPLHVETVAWISKRKDVLSAFFWMTSLWSYIYYTEQPNVKRYLIILLPFTLALMSKPMVVTLPLIMLILDFWPLKRLSSLNEAALRVREKLPFFLMAAFFSWITIYIRYPGKNPMVDTIPFSYRLANAPVAFVTYLKKTFFPYELAVFYPFPSLIPAHEVIIASIIIVMISIWMVLLTRKMPYLLAGWLWYAITLLPVIGIIQVIERALSDNYTYLPLIGIFMMAAWGTSGLLNHKRFKIFLLPLGVIILLGLSLLSWRQCATWQNNITVFGHATRVTRDNLLAHINLGFALNAQGKNEEALEHFTQAVRINPHCPEAYYNRGTMYGEMNRYDLAMEDFKKAILLKPDYVDAHYNMGTLYAKRGHYLRAIEKYNEAIRLDPGYVLAYYSRGLAYLLQGKNDPGCRDARRACALGRCELLEITRSQGKCR